jgi:hypothetical protein
MGLWCVSSAGCLPSISIVPCPSQFFRTTPPGRLIAHQDTGIYMARLLRARSRNSSLPETQTVDTELLALCVAFKLDKTDEQEQRRNWHRLWHDE